jgi:hypothetical protein
MKIMMMGSGASVCYGGLIAQQGNDVTFIARGHTWRAIAGMDCGQTCWGFYGLAR